MQISLPRSAELILFSIQSEPTTTTTNLPVGCQDYKLLNNPIRKTSYDTPLGQYKSDNSECSEYSECIASDWHGPGWYRIDPSIGSQIPTSPVKHSHCGTASAGWLYQVSTPGLGQTVNATVCFTVTKDSYDCDPISGWNVYIQIRNCRDYFLYYLSDTISCAQGYCVE